MPDFLPRREADLLQWSRNFDQKINAAPGDYALTAGQAADYRTLHDAFAEAFKLSQQASTRTPLALMAKDEAKAALLGFARVLAGVVRAAPGVDDLRRLQLGLTVRTEGRRARIGRPTEAPHVFVYAVPECCAVRVRVFDPGSAHRTAKPAGIAGATILTFVGEEPPLVLSEWTLGVQTTRTTAEVRFPRVLPPGARVWVIAQWFNPTGQRGPASPPASTRVAGGWAMAA
jgi:hypothetical protein